MTIGSPSADMIGRRTLGKYTRSHGHAAGANSWAERFPFLPVQSFEGLFGIVNRQKRKEEGRIDK